MPEASSSAKARSAGELGRGGDGGAWDPAAGTGDSDAAFAFIHAFSRAYGGDPKASCRKDAPRPRTPTTATKTRVLTELKTLAAGSVPRRPDSPGNSRARWVRGFFTRSVR